MSGVFTQGLGAPIGSIVAGPKGFIHKVHRYRKMLGGGMRQSGVIAAPGSHTFHKEASFKKSQSNWLARVTSSSSSLWIAQNKSPRVPFLQVRVSWPKCKHSWMLDANSYFKMSLLWVNDVDASLGGTWVQHAGMFVAHLFMFTGLIALEKMSKRLDVDHRNAQILAKGLAKMPLIDLDPADVHSNIIVFRLKYAPCNHHKTPKCRGKTWQALSGSSHRPA